MAESTTEYFPLTVTKEQINAQADLLRKSGAKSVLIERHDSGWSVTTEWPSAEEKYHEERFRKGG